MPFSAAMKSTKRSGWDRPLHALVAGVTGRYFEDLNEAQPWRPGVRRGVAAYALDPVAAEKLWELSERYTTG